MQKEILQCLESYNIAEADNKALEIYTFAEGHFHDYKMYLNEKRKRKKYEERPGELGRLSGYLPLIIGEYKDLIINASNVSELVFDENGMGISYQKYILQMQQMLDLLNSISINAVTGKKVSMVEAIKPLYQLILSNVELQEKWNYHMTNFNKLKNKDKRKRYIKMDKCDIHRDIAELLLLYQKSIND